ncbi:Hypothetical predicted protein, partial [Olea europaea subsp. europaea]
MDKPNESRERVSKAEQGYGRAQLWNFSCSPVSCCQLILAVCKRMVSRFSLCLSSKPQHGTASVVRLQGTAVSQLAQVRPAGLVCVVPLWHAVDNGQLDAHCKTKRVIDARRTLWVACTST